MIEKTTQEKLDIAKAAIDATNSANQESPSVNEATASEVSVAGILKFYGEINEMNEQEKIKFNDLLITLNDLANKNRTQCARKDFIKYLIKVFVTSVISAFVILFILKTIILAFQS